MDGQRPPSAASLADEPDRRATALGSVAEIGRLDCRDCMAGQVYAVGRGGSCPMLDREIIAGTSLYRTGDVGEWVWWVAAGAVELSLGDERVALRLPGTFVGAECAGDDARYVSDAAVAVSSRLCRLPRSFFVERFGCSPAELKRWLAPAVLARCTWGMR